jgi:hypothetical protein
MLPPLPRCSGRAYSSLENHPSVSAFPDSTIGSACTSSFSRFAQRSLALRPAHSRSHQIRDRYPGASDISSPPCLPRLLPAGAVAGWALHPLENAALSRRTWKAGLRHRRRRATVEAIVAPGRRRTDRSPRAGCAILGHFHAGWTPVTLRWRALARHTAGGAVTVGREFGIRRRLL